MRPERRLPGVSVGLAVIGCTAVMRRFKWSVTDSCHQAVGILVQDRPLDRGPGADERHQASSRVEGPQLRSTRPTEISIHRIDSDRDRGPTPASGNELDLPILDLGRTVLPSAGQAGNRSSDNSDGALVKSSFFMPASTTPLQTLSQHTANGVGYELANQFEQELHTL